MQGAQARRWVGSIDVGAVSIDQTACKKSSSFSNKPRACAQLCMTVGSVLRACAQLC